MMKRLLLMIVLCICMAGCGKQEGEKQEPERETQVREPENQETENQEPEKNHTENGETLAESTAAPQDLTESDGKKEEPSYDEMLSRFYQQFYAGLSLEEIIERANERVSCYQASKYHSEIIGYWEKTREVTDIANVLEPLYFTDMKYYSEEDFREDPAVVIHLAKNEIYAKHGYIFKDEDLNNYFLGCAWYQPSVEGTEFDDGVFNDFERKNLEILAAMDREKTYDAQNCGTLETTVQSFENADGKEYYYYEMERFFLKDTFSCAEAVNSRLEKIYEEYETRYTEDAGLYQNGDDDISQPYDLLHFLEITYVGEDYVSIRYNDVSYWGGAHPYSRFDGITIDCRTGREASASEILGKSDAEILKQVSSEMGLETVASWEDIDFCLSDSEIIFFYRIPNFYEEINYHWQEQGL